MPTRITISKFPE